MKSRNVSYNARDIFVKDVYKRTNAVASVSIRENLFNFVNLHVTSMFRTSTNLIEETERSKKLRPSRVTSNLHPIIEYSTKMKFAQLRKFSSLLSAHSNGGWAFTKWKAHPPLCEQRAWVKFFKLYARFVGACGSRYGDARGAENLLAFGKRQTANPSREISSDVWSGILETLVEPLVRSMARCSRKLLHFFHFSIAFWQFSIVLCRVQLNNGSNTYTYITCTWSISRLENETNVPFPRTRVINVAF